MEVTRIKLELEPIQPHMAQSQCCGVKWVAYDGAAFPTKELPL